MTPKVLREATTKRASSIVGISTSHRRSPQSQRRNQHLFGPFGRHERPLRSLSHSISRWRQHASLDSHRYFFLAIFVHDGLPLLVLSPRRKRRHSNLCHHFCRQPLHLQLPVLPHH
ncbi:hypothetical protein U9M48_023090 [Paspalum notatum var. saurae]|uniref:Uncharacterized protein n=1 Tax=Paspalum notatum var. saurae TaxID=547442 RepID=A0AAQ3TJM5_PASNO